MTSDASISDAVEEANQLNYTYMRRRDEFGKQCFFSESPTELLVDIQPDKALRKNYTLKKEVERGSQHAPVMCEHDANTEHRETDTKGINHVEGGWPKDVNPEDEEQTTRFRKKVEKDDEFINEMLHLSEIASDCIMENNAINIFQEYFKGRLMDREGPPSGRTLNVFRDPSPVKRSAAGICWNPDGGQQIAVAMCNTDFQGMRGDVNPDSYIWEIENSYKPHMTLKPPAAALSLEYNIKDPPLLLGGLLSGQVAYWDLRTGGNPVGCIAPDFGHTDYVCRALWIHSKTMSEFFSTGPDGQVLWWDIRNLKEFTDRVILDPNRGTEPEIERAQGASILEYEFTIPTRFLVGTEFGTVMSCNRKVKLAQEKVAHVYSSHMGPVYALQRNPVFQKIFLTVGDWSARVWAEDVKEISIIWSRFADTYLTGACWSPVRPSIFYTISNTGLLEAWDLQVKHTGSVLTIKVIDEALSSIRSHDKAAVLACGSKLGTVTLLEVSESLSVLRKNDKSLVTEIFDREAKREKIIEAKNKEQKLKEKTEAKGPKKLFIKDDSIDVAELENEFRTIMGVGGEGGKEESEFQII